MGSAAGWTAFAWAQPSIRGVAFKDFVWQKNATGDWEPGWTALGQGMVRFPAYCSLLAQTAFNGPVQLHFEYPLGGADGGKRQLSISRERVFSAMRRDLSQLRRYLSDAGLSHAFRL